MTDIDLYSEKVADACALIREVSGGSEYFMVFDRHPESVLDFFVAAMAEVEKRAKAAEEAKAAARIEELERELANMRAAGWTILQVWNNEGKNPGWANRFTKAKAEFSEMCSPAASIAQAKKEQE